MTYESKLLEDFSLCILEVGGSCTVPCSDFEGAAALCAHDPTLPGCSAKVGAASAVVQKNNCLGMSAERPTLPDVQPMTSFQVNSCQRLALLRCTYLRLHACPLCLRCRCCMPPCCMRFPQTPGC